MMHAQPLIVSVTNWRHEEVLKTFSAGSYEEAFAYAQNYAQVRGWSGEKEENHTREEDCWLLQDLGIAVILRPMTQTEVTNWVNS